MQKIFTFQYELTVRGETIHLTPRTVPAGYSARNAPIVGTVGDNKAQALSFTRPGFEGYDLVLLFESEGIERTAFPEQNLLKENEFVITNALTQNPLLHMQVQLRDGLDILAGSQTVSMAFRPSLASGETPIEPLPDPLREIRGAAFTGVSLEDGTYRFQNIAGQEVATVPGGGGTGAETDPVYMADKPNIALKSDLEPIFDHVGQLDQITAEQQQDIEGLGERTASNESAIAALQEEITGVADLQQINLDLIGGTA